MRITESTIRRIIREEARRVLGETETRFNRNAESEVYSGNAKTPSITTSNLGTVVTAIKVMGNEELAKIVFNKGGRDDNDKVTLQPIDGRYQEFNVYIGNDTDTMPLNAGKGYISVAALQRVGISIERRRD